MIFRMIYRIKITIGYKDAYIDFDNAADAAEFASTILSHYKQPKDEKNLMKVVIEVVNPIAVEEDED